MKAKESRSQLNVEELSDFKLLSSQTLMRTTLRFSKKGHEAIKKLSVVTGKKNADVFATVLAWIPKIINNKSDISNLKKELETIRKTYVVGKKTLSKISALAKELELPRDLLIDWIAQRLVTLAETEASEKNKNYRNINEKIINPFWSKAEEIEKELKEILGEDDPAVNRFGVIINHIGNLSGEIDDYLSSGSPIEEF